MTNDALLVLETLFQTIWRLFTSWNFPGTNVTPAEMFLFLISAGIGLRYVLMFLHSPNASASSGLASGKAIDEKRLQRHLAQNYHTHRN